MQFRQFLLPFALGVAVGVVLHRSWPKIREIGGPLLRDALKGGTNLAGKAREALHEQSEKFSDLVAEIREEEEQKAKAGLTPAAAAPPTGAAPAAGPT